MGRSLDPEFDLMAMGQDMVKELVKNQYSMQRISKDLLWVAKDAAAQRESELDEELRSAERAAADAPPPAA